MARCLGNINGNKIFVINVVLTHSSITSLFWGIAEFYSHKFHLNARVIEYTLFSACQTLKCSEVSDFQHLAYMMSSNARVTNFKRT